MNPCRCGYLMDDDRQCNRAPDCGLDYQNKISGPILDRIDLIIEVAQIDIFSDDRNNDSSMDSERVLQRVLKARKIQAKRYESQTKNIKQNNKTNSRLSGKILDDCTSLDAESIEILKLAMKKMKLSMRGYSRILRVARTIADLDNSEKLTKYHILEAISYRRSLI